LTIWPSRTHSSLKHRAGLKVSKKNTLKKCYN
jgi:hypothetical protein